MGKLILRNSISLEQLRSAAMLLFGRVTYAGMAVADYMNKLPKTVLSSKLDRAGWANTKPVRGATLFGRGRRRVNMELLEARPVSNGCVILRYEPSKDK
jgi:Mn-dependent DtxR family transcriptional regulator